MKLTQRLKNIKKKSLIHLGTQIAVGFICLSLGFDKRYITFYEMIKDNKFDLDIIINEILI